MLIFSAYLVSPAEREAAAYHLNAFAFRDAPYHVNDLFGFPVCRPREKYNKLVAADSGDYITLSAVILNSVRAFFYKRVPAVVPENVVYKL